MWSSVLPSSTSAFLVNTVSPAVLQRAELRLLAAGREQKNPPGLQMGTGSLVAKGPVTYLFSEVFGINPTPRDGGSIH